MSPAQPAEPAPANEPKHKRRGKLPVIVMVAVLLGAGGFFGVKARHPAAHAAPAVKLGSVLKLEEFLVNLGDGTTYLRTEIYLHLAQGAKLESGGEGGVNEQIPVIRNAIINVLTSRSFDEVKSLEGKAKLRRELAAAVNRALEELECAKSGEAPPKPEADAPGTPAHPDWDSDTGPVLKVYFTSFATQ